jgi:hypothetical protein
VAPFALSSIEALEKLYSFDRQRLGAQLVRGEPFLDELHEGRMARFVVLRRRMDQRKDSYARVAAAAFGGHRNLS